MLIDCEPWSKFLPRRVSKVPVVRSLRNPFVCVTLAREGVKIWWTGFNCLLSCIIQLFFNYVTCGSPKQCKWRHFPWENLDMQLIHVLGLRIWRGQYKRKSWRWKKRRPGQLLPHFCQFLSLFCYFLPHFCQFLSLFATFCHYLSFFLPFIHLWKFPVQGEPKKINAGRGDREDRQLAKENFKAFAAAHWFHKWHPYASHMPLPAISKCYLHCQPPPLYDS